MGSHQPAVETRSNLVLRLKENADLSHSLCFPPPPCLLCPPEQTKPDQGPTPGSEPERELPQHQVLHWQPGHRLCSLGSCPGCGHPILCQPGVQPVQEQGRHQEQQQQGNQQRDPWIPRRFRCSLSGSECWTHPQLRVNTSNKKEVNSILCETKLYRLSFIG